jgi:hypothetical protein
LKEKRQFLPPAIFMEGGGFGGPEKGNAANAGRGE